MIIIGTEENLANAFAYKNIAVFTTTTAKKGCELAERVLTYKQLSDFLPSNDDIGAVIRGEKKLKALTKAAIKKLHNPKAEGAANVGMTMAMLITAATSDRRNKNGPPVLAFVLDDEDEARNKVIVKFLTALFKEFGITPVTKKKHFKGIFKVTKKELKKANKNRKKKDKLKKKGLVKAKLIRFESDKDNKCTLSNKGVELKKSLLRYYDIELRQMAANELEVTDINSTTVQSWAKSLVRIYTGENLRDISKKKVAKLLAKKDKRAVKYYKELREILLSMDKNNKMPAVKFGQKRKKGKASGPKFKTKKFIKFFTKYRNRGYLLLVFGHTTLRMLDREIGSKDYNQQMKVICNNVGQDGFAKLFIAAASAYATPAESK